MDEIRWFRVCPADELKPGRARSVKLLAREFAVFNIGGELYGIDGSCRHMKASLAAGRLNGEIVECFMHGWKYNVRTGDCLTVPASRVRTYPVRAVDGEIKIGIQWPPPPADPFDEVGETHST